MNSIFEYADKPDAEFPEQQPESEVKGRLRQGATASVIAAVIVLCILFCPGCQSGAKIPRQFTGAETGELAPGDVVKLTFPGAPDLNQSQKIRADGKVSLPLIGEVDAAGKRVGKFQEEVDRLYTSQLKNNAVTVSLDASSVPVYVTGAVGRPGKVILERPMTLLEAIMEVGGISNLGTLKGVVLIRNANGQHFTQVFDLSPALKGRKTDAFYLKPYDMIYVPERFF
jgi:polysaccharide export outer membrane protein